MIRLEAVLANPGGHILLQPGLAQDCEPACVWKLLGCAPARSESHVRLSTIDRVEGEARR